ncbi:ABC transporter permease [Paenibacillus nasutitermitis]|uniref:ABC transporter permease n=1 Tax=Paenibacillus nasutitermitis TaxID=1652958 RepID=A0A916YUN1_9BACL|nr:ABC transporter permease [Paenibacillus nasutitermitis]GGD62466.1 ABC transporter permease [Paenibacillus nasutitermitis]
MFSLTANVRNEIEKWWLQRKTKWFLLFIVLIPVLIAWLVAGMQGNIGISAILGTDFPLIMLGLLTSVLLPLYLFMAAADSFSGEAASRTLKIVLVRPISRAKVFASKVLALAFIAIAVLAGGWVASVLSGLSLPGSGSAIGIWNGMTAYFAAIFPMVTIAIFAVLVAQWFNNSTTTLVICIVLYAAVKVLPFFLPEAAVWSPFAYTDWHTMWTSGNVSVLKLLNIIVFLGSCSIIGYTAGLYRFAARSL